MDTEKLAANEGYDRLGAMRDDMLLQAGSYVVSLRQRADILAQGNRAHRRKGLSAHRKIDAFEQWINARIGEEFEKLAGGYDPAAGTLECVQREAARKLAAIFD